MSPFLIYILESTFCICVFYSLFKLLMLKDTSFAVNRVTLLTIVVVSVIIPSVHIPQLLQTPVHVGLIPDFSENKIQIQNISVTSEATSVKVLPNVSQATPIANKQTIPLETLLRYFYLAGVAFAFLFLLQNIVRIFFLMRKATVRQMDGYRLLIVDREVPSFAFGRSVVISRTDYDAHGPAILAHEKAHISMNHFADLLLLELVKTIHWFNPAIYALIRDLKEIHEFQADQQTLHSGIDATQYQLLIIQKGVGPRRFALANSFNHCQIKKRITMMNNSKNSKAWRWKVATFLPLLALLLMAFGKPGENSQSQVKQWKESDFGDPNKIIDTTRSGINYMTYIYIDSKSQFRLSMKKESPDKISNYIRKYLDYGFADDATRKSFKKININGQSRMIQGVTLVISRHKKTPMEDYQKLLNLIGKVVMETRQKYSKELFNDNYEMLSSVQQDEIKQLIPAFAFCNMMPDNYYPI